MAQWVPMKEAASILGISYSKVLRLVQKGAIKTEEDILDARVKLVDLEEVKRVFRIKA